jgi:RNA polymerase sigma factor (sigma-70 family)
VPRDEAADLANETMVRMLVHLKRHGRDRTDLGPLVRTIARNLLIERVRKQAPVCLPLGDDIDVADDALEPLDQFVVSERRDAVRRAIGSLSPRHRHVVGLWMDGRTPQEIGRELGIKRNAVDAILHRARRSLAAKLDSGGVLGVFGVIGFRIRSVVRRAAAAFVHADPSGQTVATASGLVAVSLAAVVSLSPNATAAPKSASELEPVRAIATQVEATHAGATDNVVERVARDVRGTADRVRTTTREFGTSIRTANGEDVQVGLAERERADGRRSLLGPLLRSIVTDNACRAAECTSR